MTTSRGRIESDVSISYAVNELEKKFNQLKSKADLNNDDKENNYVKVYTLSYPFIKQGCRFTMEDWTIDVYLA